MKDSFDNLEVFKLYVLYTITKQIKHNSALYYSTTMITISIKHASVR